MITYKESFSMVSHMIHRVVKIFTLSRVEIIFTEIMMPKLEKYFTFTKLCMILKKQLYASYRK